jgi:hypothetical protein
MDRWIDGLKEYQTTRLSVRYGMPYGNGEGQISEYQKKLSDNLSSEISF